MGTFHDDRNLSPAFRISLQMLFRRFPCGELLARGKHGIPIFQNDYDITFHIISLRLDTYMNNRV